MVPESDARRVMTPLLQYNYVDNKTKKEKLKKQKQAPDNLSHILVAAACLCYRLVTPLCFSSSFFSSSFFRGEGYEGWGNVCVSCK